MELAAASTVDSLLRDWYIPVRLLGRSSNTIRSYRYTLALFSKTLGRPALLSDLQDRTICAVLASLVASGAEASTINAVRRTMLALAQFAWHKRLIEEMPSVPRLVEPEPDATAYSESEVGLILAECARRHGIYHGVSIAAGWRALILLLWYTGVRITAMLSLRMADIQLPTVTIRARAQKHKRTQVFLLPGDCCEAVEAVLLPERELLFLGAPLNRIRKTFTEILTLAGLPHGPREKFQKLRRSCAQACHRAGGDASLHLGHSSRQITERHYLGIMPVDATIIPKPQYCQSPQQLLF